MHKEISPGKIGRLLEDYMHVRVLITIRNRALFIHTYAHMHERTMYVQYVDVIRALTIHEHLLVQSAVMAFRLQRASEIA